MAVGLVWVPFLLAVCHVFVCPFTKVEESFSMHLSGIHSLDVQGCGLITNAFFAHLSGTRMISVQGCPSVSLAGVGLYDLGIYSVCV